MKAYIFLTAVNSQEQKELNKLIDKLGSPNYEHDKAELLSDLSILLESHPSGVSAPNLCEAQTD